MQLWNGRNKKVPIPLSSPMWKRKWHLRTISNFFWKHHFANHIKKKTYTVYTKNEKIQTPISIKVSINVDKYIKQKWITLWIWSNCARYNYVVGKTMLYANTFKLKDEKALLNIFRLPVVLQILFLYFTVIYYGKELLFFMNNNFVCKDLFEMHHFPKFSSILYHIKRITSTTFYG